MAKEYSEWLGSMANSIEDASIVDRFVGDTMSALQKRMVIADLLVPYADDKEYVDDWVAAFSVAMSCDVIGRRKLTEATLSSLIGQTYTALYCDTRTSRDAVAWLKDLKKQIKYNKLKRD